MGDPTDTITTMLHAFQARYAAFRAELPRHLQGSFDALYRDAVRSAPSLNRRPTVDCERPILLAMLVAQHHREEVARRALDKATRRIERLEQLLDDHGIQVSPLRGTRPLGPDLDRLGQERLTNYPTPDPVPAQLPGRPAA